MITTGSGPPSPITPPCPDLPSILDHLVPLLRINCTHSIPSTNVYNQKDIQASWHDTYDDVTTSRLLGFSIYSLFSYSPREGRNRPQSTKPNNNPHNHNVAIIVSPAIVFTHWTLSYRQNTPFREFGEGAMDFRIDLIDGSMLKMVFGAEYAFMGSNMYTMCNLPPPRC
jgi:hypothetical protein